MKYGLVIVLLAMLLVSLVSGSNSFSIFERAQACNNNGIEGECDGSEEIEGMSFMMRSAGKSRPIRNLRLMRYISYDALKKDNIPCTRPGNSYYNCNNSREKANPYRRGCSAITHCARILV